MVFLAILVSIMGVVLDVGSGCVSVLAGGENSCCLEKSLVGYLIHIIMCCVVSRNIPCHII